MTRRSGLSLLETVIALFLLVAEVLVLLGAFHQGVRHQARTYMQAQAIGVVQQTFSEIRAWARVPANYDSNWSAYHGVTRQDGAFRVLIECAPGGQPLASPCNSLELPWSSRAKLLRRSVVPVKVTAVWDPSDARARLSVTSYLGEPPRAPDPVLRITQTGGPTSPVPQNGVMAFQVEARDSAGNPLRDLQYSWYVKPFTGNASVLGGGPRDGTSAEVKHAYVYNGITLHVAGTIQVECRARYHGRELRGLTPNIILAP
jgi:Tfp pilus assembly protein PilV